jgi:hypothetical protein
MDWIRQGWEEYKLALGLRRYIVINLSFVAANIIAVAYFFETGLKMSPIPFISISAFVLFIILLIEISDHAIRLRRSVMPKIQLDFDERGGSLVKVTLGLFQNTEMIGQTNCFYLRGKVTCLGKLAAQNCEALLTNIEKRSGNNWESVGFSDSVDLPWANRRERGFSPLSIAVGARRYFDIFYTREDTNQLVPATPWPAHMQNLFDAPGIFRIEIGVLCEGVLETIHVIVDWTGIWDTVKASKE